MIPSAPRTTMRGPGPLLDVGPAPQPSARLVDHRRRKRPAPPQRRRRPRVPPAELRRDLPGRHQLVTVDLIHPGPSFTSATGPSKTTPGSQHVSRPPGAATQGDLCPPPERRRPHREADAETIVVRDTTGGPRAQGSRYRGDEPARAHPASGSSSMAAELPLEHSPDTNAIRQRIDGSGLRATHPCLGCARSRVLLATRGGYGGVGQPGRRAGSPP